MDLIIENEYLKVTVTTSGAQIKSILRKDDGTEHIWQADPAVWGYHAPILFPYAGKVKNGIITVNGKDYDGSRQHGFARNSRSSQRRYPSSRLGLKLYAGRSPRAYQCIRRARRRRTLEKS